MTHNRNFATARTQIVRATVLALLAGAIAACNRTDGNNRDLAAPPPQPAPTTTVVVSPQPAPTTTVVVTPEPAPTTTVVVTPSPQPREPIADIGVIATAPDPASLAGKQALLTDVTVQRVVGDRTFWVSSGNAQQLFVVLDNSLDAGSAENQIVVKEGQTVDLTGALRTMPSAQQAEQQWGLSADEAQELNSQPLYLQAQNIQFKAGDR